MTLLLLGGAGIFSACSDAFLDRTPQDAPGAGNFLKDETSAKQLVIAAYNPWQEQMDMYGKRFVTACDAMTDDSGIRNNDEAATWTFLPTSGYATAWWRYAYQSVNAANYAIEQIPNLKEKGFTDAQIDPYIAEARFMRGFDYLFLTTFYGDVPLITKPLTSFAEYSQPKAAVADIFAQIISDFTFAKEHLNATNDKSGTPTQATAAAYLAKAHLYKKDYPAAETAAREAITLAETAGYALIDDYEAIFTVANENNPELLFYFEFEANKSISGGQDGNVWIVERMIRNLPAPFKHIIGAADGWGYALPTRDLYDAFESDDPRRGATLYAPGDDYGIYREGSPYEHKYKTYIGNVLTDYSVTYQVGDMVKYDLGFNSPTGLNCKKLTDNLAVLSNPRLSGVDVPLLRMADLYLFLAEALAEQNKAEALVWVNKVRARASVDVPARTIGDGRKADGSLRDIVRHERRVELATEGHRIFDLLRWDALKEVFGNGGEEKVKLHFYSDVKGGSADGEDGRFKRAIGLSRFPTNHILLPIPQYEMDNNTAITSNNPGY
ncbi:membrane protein [Bacteroidia bacterium]|nr:membrane protein [Bacteroidia bacterium]